MKRWWHRNGITRTDEFLQLRELLQEGMRLFHAGERHRLNAILALEAVLRDPLSVASFRLAAAVLLAETHRGVADFVRAEQYYELGLTEARAIPMVEREANEWYLHYRPRCALGLAMALRRSMSPAPERIRELLRGTRDDFSGLPAADLTAQLNAVEGLYCRQQGDLDGAITLLDQAYGELAERPPPYLLLAPDHVAALLAQLYTLSPSTRVRVDMSVRRILRSSDAGSWSKAVAAACLLHVRLDRILRDTASPIQLRDALAEFDDHDQLVEAMTRCSDAEGDPLLLTESLVLRAAWHAAAGQVDDAHGLVERLVDATAPLPQPGMLLRAVEAAMIFDCFEPPGAKSTAALEKLRKSGRSALAALAEGLERHGCNAMRATWMERLQAGRPANGNRPLSWFIDELCALRRVAWP